MGGFVRGHKLESWWDTQKLSDDREGFFFTYLPYNLIKYVQVCMPFLCRFV